MWIAKEATCIWLMHGHKDFAIGQLAADLSRSWSLLSRSLCCHAPPGLLLLHSASGILLQLSSNIHTASTAIELPVPAKALSRTGYAFAPAAISSALLRVALSRTIGAIPAGLAVVPIAFWPLWSRQRRPDELLRGAQASTAGMLWRLETEWRTVVRGG